ncbi:hypothetical protein FJQ98_16665 [Lysinibacillus agricola]|uniref:Uncharacterized protein n=1 Tax=Lysinibacillus agricola TaxID=2590012 RepID=A0ABX7APN1_9BACI|nr:MULTISPECIES: hypothetical protein [Lysinibacillus]KOS61442.1 hypothetical protein AN161_17765 [Lysinibacillus sp. FJAT-14222]QQP10878.1 hypothetical protein FJQ98_16665 [Lysinibacillus agricola]
MTKKRQLLTSSIIEISSKDDVSREIVMLVHKLDTTNANGLDFKENYTETYMNSLINKPVVTKYFDKIEDLGTHEQIVDDDGNIVGLETIAIGTIKEVWIDKVEDDEDVKALYAKADLWNYKYPEIIACVEKLFNEDNADSSVEVEIYAYEDNPTQDYRVAKEYTYLSNCLLGSSISPADSDAGVISIAQREIAMAVKNDLQKIKNEQKGVNKLAEKELFNKGYKTKFHIEISELSHDDIRQQIYNFINPVNPTTEERSYKYWIREVFQTYVIVEEWNDSNKLYKIDYSLNDDTVVLSSDYQQVEITYQVVGTNINGELNKLQTELNSTKEELSKMDKTNEAKVVELQNKIEELEAKVVELNSTVVEQQEAKTALESQVTELNSTVEKLGKYKEQVETAEKEAKLTELSSRYEKLLSEETFKTTEVQEALQSLDAQKLNEIVVNEVAKSKSITEVNSITTKDIIVNAKQGENLIPQTILQKYEIK